MQQYPSKVAVERLTTLIQPCFPGEGHEGFYGDYDCVVDCAIYRSGGRLRPQYELQISGDVLRREPPERIAEVLQAKDLATALEGRSPLVLLVDENGDCVLMPAEERPVTDW